MSSGKGVTGDGHQYDVGSHLDFLVDTLLTPDFGTFWWVNESRAMQQFTESGVKYDSGSTRKAHPHVSILESNLKGRGFIPFLFGASLGNEHHHVRVFGLTDAEPDAPTYFGVIQQPVCLSPAEMLSRREEAEYNPQRRPDEGADDYSKRIFASLAGPSWERSTIWPNWDRLEANESEQSRLKKWCKQRNLLDG